MLSSVINTVIICWNVLFLTDYKKALDSWSTESAETMENSIHEVCDSANKALDKKLQELYSVMEDIGQCSLCKL